MRKSLLIAIVFMLLLPILYAEDFSAFTYKKDVFTCEFNPNYLDVLTIVNNGFIPHSYTITYVGAASEWTTAMPDSFALGPGDSQTVYVHITSPIDAHGDFDLKTVVTADDNIIKSFSQNVRVEKCNNIKAITEFGRVNTCPGRTITLPINIENSGVYNDKYSLSVDSDLKTITTFSSDNFILEPNQKHDVFAMVELPSDQYGLYGYDILIKAKSSGLLSRLPVEVNVMPCYDYGVFMQSNYESCKLINSNISFIINNLADADNYFNFKLDGPDWAHLTTKKVFVKSKESAEVKIDVTPPFSQPVTDVILYVESEYGSLKSNKTFSITPAHCYDLEINMDENLATCGCEQDKFSITVKNKGTKQDEFDLSLQTSKNLLVDDWNKSVIIDSGSEISFDMYVDVPCSISGNYDTQVTAISEITGLIYENEGTINIVSPNECREAEFDMPDVKYNFSTDPISGFLNIKNVGVKKGTYLINGYPSDKISVGAKAVTLEPGLDFDVPLTYNILEKGTYKFLFEAKTDNNQTYAKNYYVGFSSFINWNSLWVKIALVLGFLILLLLLIILLANYKGRTKHEIHELVESQDKKQKKNVKPVKKSVKKKAEKKIVEKVDDVKEYRIKPFFKWIILLLLLIFLLFGIYYAYTNYSSFGNNETIAQENESISSNSRFQDFFDGLMALPLNSNETVSDDGVSFTDEPGNVSQYSFINMTILKNYASDSYDFFNQNMLNTVLLFNQSATRINDYTSRGLDKSWYYLRILGVYFKAFLIGYIYYILIGIIILILLIFLIDQKYYGGKSKDVRINKPKKSNGFLKKLFSINFKKKPNRRKNTMLKRIANFFFEVDGKEEIKKESEQELVQTLPDEPEPEMIEKKEPKTSFGKKIVEFFFDVEHEEVKEVKQPKPEEIKEVEESKEQKVALKKDTLATKPTPKEVKQIAKKTVKVKKKNLAKKTVVTKKKASKKTKKKPLLPEPWSKVTKYKKIK